MTELTECAKAFLVMAYEDWAEDFNGKPTPDAIDIEGARRFADMIRAVADCIGFGEGHAYDFAGWFFYRFDVSLSWEWSDEYTYGDDADGNRGYLTRDIEEVIFDGADSFTRSEWRVVIGDDAIDAIERWALENVEPEE